MTDRNSGISTLTVVQILRINPGEVFPGVETRAFFARLQTSVIMQLRGGWVWQGVNLFGVAAGNSKKGEETRGN
jgi:hypothetical protein